MKTGLVLGKFMPPHKGHELLLSFAYQFVHKLHIIIDNIDDGRYGEQYISGEKRVAWIQKKFPLAIVTYLSSPMPQDPTMPGFWQTWKESITQIVGDTCDYIFASDSYGFELAERLGARFIPVDILREIHHISATKIRNNLNEHWDKLASFVQADFLLKIAIIGPESTGKTTLTKALATYYQTTYVPEYARLYLEPIMHERGISISEMNFRDDDFTHIVKGQQILDETLSHNANRILFTDTDPLLTMVWYSSIMNTAAPPELMNRALTSSYDLYLVCKPNLPWVQDVLRYEDKQAERQTFFEHTISLLEKNNRPYHIIDGLYEHRIEQAQYIIDELIQTKLHLNNFSKKW